MKCQTPPQTPVKPVTGCLHCMTPTGIRQLNFRPTSPGYVDSKKLDLKRQDFTGSYSPPSNAQQDSPLLKKSLEMEYTLNQAEAKQLKNMYSRKIRPSQVLDSNWNSKWNAQLNKPM